MNKNVSFDVFSCVELIYERMNNNYLFAFPDNNFSESRGHQVLCRFTVFSNFLNRIFDKEFITMENSLQDIYTQQVLSNLNVIIFDKEWSYRNGNYDSHRALTSLNCIESSLKNYQKGISLLGEHCLKNNNVIFNLIDFFENLSCAKYYNYAYPKDYYSESQAHPSFQMLLALTDSLPFVINSIKTEDNELIDILSGISEKLNVSKDYLNKAYPNSSFDKSVGHACLTEFIKSWKSFKEFSLISLKNYFEKQDLIKDYENKINSFTQPLSSDIPLHNYESSVVTPISVPVIKKIKSLL